jgi:5-formyltetrahydrofolate cyclo-ligase
MNKAQLREQLKQRRQELSSTQRQLFSQKICQQLQSLDWSGIHSLHCFTPIARLAEVDISSFVAALIVSYPKLQIYTPHHIDGAWEIVSWQDHTATREQQFEAVIVPMLGFDTSLQRIGYGGGYYDKFLLTQNHAKKIGVSFELGRVGQIPAESHDIALDTIITDTRTYP